ncbi:MAG: hypothetical protein AAF762_04025 [Pseudomonadota bacterium]
MFGSSNTGDWQDANALLIDTIADLLAKMSSESEGMQVSIGEAVGSEVDTKAALMKLQRLDFHTQKQADLASVLRVLAGFVRSGEFNVAAVESAANRRELQDALAQRPVSKPRRRISLGRLDWFD